MGKQGRKKLNNAGASLIAVLVAISVVSIMGIIITQLTVTNIQMKEVERQGKTNFYDAEHVMDDLTAGLNGIAAEAMEKAYTDMLGRYREVTADGSTAKEVFARMYLENMITALKSDKASLSRSDGDGKVLFTRGYYSISKVKESLKKSALFGGSDYTVAEKDSYITIPVKDSTHPDCAEFFSADFENCEFILEDIRVSVKDKFGNMVTIKTDMVFHTPELNLDGSNLVKEFMRYSLIADEQILVGSSGVVVDGNAYAGSGGIKAEPNGQASFIGKKVITRGNVVVYSKGNLTLGKESDLGRTQVWAKGLETARDSRFTGTEANRAKMNLYGYMFIADDLELNGAYDEVNMKGEYYGYNFQENYDYSTSVTLNNKPLEDARYSSAIVINGKKAKIDMSGLNRLMIAGRTFIGRNAGYQTTDAYKNSADIAMGESLAVKTNQIAYYVPDGCIDTASHRVLDDQYYRTYGIANVSDYLDPSEPYTVFRYRYLSTAPEVIYYLNFKDNQAANDFYAKYYEKKGNALNVYAENFLEANALKLSGDVVLLLQGDLLYRNGSTGKLNEYKTNIDSSTWGYGQIYYKFSSNHALMYKALQLTLEDKISGLKPEEARLVETDENKMFKSLINEDALNALVTGPNATETNKYVKTYTDPDGIVPGTRLLAIVKGDFQVDSTYVGGLVVATGDVYVATGSGSGKFAGTIISKGTITFADNAEVSADEVLISQMISQDIRRTIPEFATIFQGYQASADAAMGTATINKYLTYENWTKTYDE